MFVLLSVVFAVFCACFACGDCFWASVTRLSDFEKNVSPDGS
jgi:hypothetical protein